MGFNLHRLPSGRMLSLTDGEVTTVRALVDNAERPYDLAPAERPHRHQARVMYALAGAGALVRRGDDTDRYLFARCFWGDRCPHPDGHGDDADRYGVDLLKPMRRIQSVIGAAIAAGWTDTVHDVDAWIIYFERPGSPEIAVRFTRHGGLAAWMIDDDEPDDMTLKPLLRQLTAPPRVPRRPVRHRAVR